jgi:DNA-binding NtrC family response regulator
MPSPIQILIVDDEIRYLETLAQRLDLRGFSVITAAGGHEALDRARGCEVDIALIDLQMPRMHGEELLGRLKEEHPLMEVVILTGHGSAASRDRCDEAGSYCYLDKPCETDQLVEVLRQAYEKRVLKRLDIERAELQRLLRASAGESSLHVILRMRELEEEILRRQG